MHDKLLTPTPTPAPLRQAVPPQPKTEVPNYSHGPPGVNSRPVPTTKPPLPSKREPSVLAKDSGLVAEGPTLTSWKLVNPSSPSNEDKECASAVKSTMPATDVKETTGGGASLKERMAAFQGKGGTGSANPPPLPTTKKPMPKPSPKPTSSPSLAEKNPAEFRAVICPPLLDTESTVQVPTEKLAEFAEQRGEVDGIKKDPEEEERQRRVETTARVKRLDGANMGREPPVIAPKPFARRPGVPKEEKTRPGTDCIQFLR